MFQLSGLHHEPFEPLFALSDAALADRGIARRTADSATGFPCRVSLEDAAPGDELLLLHYVHHAVASPYRASGPVYVRRGQRRRVLAPGLVPPYVTRRLISLRAYDAGHMMVSADVVEGPAVARALDALFSADAVAYVHLHNAKPGCFSCHAARA